MTVPPPSEWPRRFVFVTRAIVVEMWTKNALVDASAMAFSLFLASIPLLALAGFVVAEILTGEPRALTMVSSLVDVAPDEVRSLVARHLERGGGQGVAAPFLAGSLWLAASAFHDAMTVFEGAVGAEPRTWLRKRLIAIGCVLGLLAVLVTTGWGLLTFTGGPLGLVVAFVARAERASPEIVAALLAAGAALVLVAAFFRIAVRHRTAHPPVFPGALATVLMGTVTSYSFGRYSRSIARYAVFYGSLAAVAVFLLWLWICCIALLVGVEVNAHIERERTARRSLRP